MSKEMNNKEQVSSVVMTENRYETTQALPTTTAAKRKHCNPQKVGNVEQIIFYRKAITKAVKAQQMLDVALTQMSEQLHELERDVPTNKANDKPAREEENVAGSGSESDSSDVVLVKLQEMRKRGRKNGREHDRDRSRGHSRGRSRGCSRGHSRGRSRGCSRGHSRGRSRSRSHRRSHRAVSSSSSSSEDMWHGGQYSRTHKNKHGKHGKRGHHFMKCHGHGPWGKGHTLGHRWSKRMVDGHFAHY